MRPIIRPGNDHRPRRDRAAWGVFFTLVPVGIIFVALITIGTVTTL